MQLYLFQSGIEPEVFGLTADAAGLNLPSAFKPWQRYGNALNVCASKVVTSANSSDTIIRTVQREGFYLARGGIKILE